MMLPLVGAKDLDESISRASGVGEFCVKLLDNCLEMCDFAVYRWSQKSMKCGS